MTATPQDKAIRAARARNLTAAKRSLKLIADVAAQHAGLLKAGTVPEASFLVHAQKYEQARASLELLDMISTAKLSEADGTVEVVATDLEDLIKVFQAFQLVPPEAWEGDTALARLFRLAYPDAVDRSATPPWEGDEVPFAAPAGSIPGSIPSADPAGSRPAAPAVPAATQTANPVTSEPVPGGTTGLGWTGDEQP